MRTVHLRAVAVLVMLITLAAGCSGTGDERRSPSPSHQSPVSATERTVPLQVVHRGGRVLAFVPITIDGHGPLLFALDTGASDSVVDKGVASTLNLHQAGHVDISGVVGQRSVPLVKVGHWDAGSVRLPSDTLAVIDLAGPERGGLQGLLGSDVLSKFGTVTVDYRAEKLRLPAR